MMLVGDFQMYAHIGLFVVDDPRDAFGELKTNLAIDRAVKVASGVVVANRKHKGGKND